jgi:predicted nucleotidyltransferase
MSCAGDGNSEIGRELTVTDLKVERVVVISPPSINLMLTMWVEDIDETTVTFFSGVMNWRVINFVKDGTLVDDRGRLVRVFEYLGEV